MSGAGKCTPVSPFVKRGSAHELINLYVIETDLSGIHKKDIPRRIRLMPKIIAIGDIVNDFSVGTIDTFPIIGEVIAVERIKPVLGGNAANMASGLGKMGVAVKILGKIGNDMFGDFVLQRLRLCGVDISDIERVADIQTPITLAFNNKKGERCFIQYFGTNEIITEEDIDLSSYETPAIFYCGGIEMLPQLRGKSLSRVLKHAQCQGIWTVLDTAYDPFNEWFPVIEPSLPFIDILFLGMSEAKFYANTDDPKKIIDFFKSHHIKKMVIKMGEEGCIVNYEEKRLRVPVPKVEVRDTTGAGDNFVAGFLAGIVRKASIEDCARFGVAAGSLSTEYYGGEAHYSGFDEVWRLANTLPVITVTD